MSTTWAEIDRELRAFASTNEFEHGGKMHDFLLLWGNDLQDEICRSFDIREHLQTCTITFTTSDSYKSLPDIFLKKSERFTRVRVGTNWVDIITKEELDDYDPDHDATTSNDYPDAVAIDGNKIYITPMWSGTLTLQDYIRRPAKMIDSSGSPDLPEPSDSGVTLKSLFFTGVGKKMFLWLQDFDMVNWCTAEYARLLDLYETNLKKTNSKQKIEHTYY